MIFLGTPFTRRILAENVWIGIEVLAPVGVGQDDHSAILHRRDRFRLSKRAAQDRTDAQRPEKIR